MEVAMDEHGRTTRPGRGRLADGPVPVAGIAPPAGASEVAILVIAAVRPSGQRDRAARAWMAVEQVDDRRRIGNVEIGRACQPRHQQRGGRPFRGRDEARRRDAGAGERGQRRDLPGDRVGLLLEEPAVVVPAQDLAALEHEDRRRCWPAVGVTTPSAGYEPSTDASQSMTSGVSDVNRVPPAPPGGGRGPRPRGPCRDAPGR